eukprot:1446308-Rhodomonas_salina.5
MGNQLATRLHVDFMSELPKVDKDGEGIVFGRILGGGRFLKSLQCWHRGNMVVVKAYSKRDINESLREYGERLETIRDKLSSVQHPNILPFTWFPETQRAAFLVRAYVQSSLKERITSRPLLTSIEKRWITFQLLTALEQVLPVPSSVFLTPPCAHPSATLNSRCELLLSSLSATPLFLSAQTHSRSCSATAQDWCMATSRQTTSSSPRTTGWSDNSLPLLTLSALSRSRLPSLSLSPTYPPSLSSCFLL